jgi:hypothetical protein
VIDPALEKARELCSRLLHPHARYAGQPIKTQNGMEDWAVLGPVLLARAAYSIESVLALSDREIDAAIIARTVYEVSTMFAWIAVDPPSHALCWAREDIRQRLTMAKEIHELRSTASEPERRKIDRTAASLESRLESLKHHRRLPKLEAMAKQADAHWVPRLPTLLKAGATSFRGTYTTIYRGSSQSAHGLFLPLRSFIEPLAPGLVRTARPIVDASTQIRLAPYAFGNALAVASIALGWPTEHDLDHAFTFKTTRVRA